ncbi:MAG TPA: Ig-like domain-containing protein, partial [Verrucomicrobiae bacterium]|nr:Ig-like domain-containing protein [Verrucomicrobiae bacterium]
MKSLLCALAVTGLTLLCAWTAHSQPANDNFVNAWTLTGTVVTTNGNSGQTQQGIANATKEAGEPNHAGLPGGRSVWFNWTAPTNGQTRVDTLDSQFNTLLAVYTGTSVSALTLVAANDNISEGFGGNNRSRLEFFAMAGTTYRIAIDGRSGFSGQNPASGPYVLNLRMLASVFIATPTNGSVVSLGTPIPIHVEASVPGATVTRVDLYRTGGLLGSVATPPYDFNIASPPPGTNSFVAIALDNTGLSWTSAVVNVAVLSLGLNLVSPPDGAVFLNTNPITVSALPLLQSGAMTNVEFFVDGQKFGQDATAPFSAVWAGVTGGAHRFTATGKDNAGNTYSAAPVSIAVSSTLVSRGSNW